MLLSFFKDNTEIKLIRVIMDNNAVVAYINNTRGIKSDLCDNIGFTHGNGLQNYKHVFQEHTSLDLKKL